MAMKAPSAPSLRAGSSLPPHSLKNINANLPLFEELGISSLSDLKSFRELDEQSGQSLSFIEFVVAVLPANEAVKYLEYVYQNDRNGSLISMYTDAKSDQRVGLLQMAIASKSMYEGQTDILDWIVSKPQFVSKFKKDVAHTVATYGRPAGLTWLASRPEYESLLFETNSAGNDLIEQAIHNDQDSVLAWVYQQPAPIGNMLYENKTSQFPVRKGFRKLKSLPRKIQYNFAYTAFATGKEKCARWFLEASRKDERVRALWSEHMVAIGKNSYSVLDLLGCAMEAKEDKVAKMLPANIGAVAGGLFKKFELTAEAFSNEIAFSEKKEAALRQVSQMAERLSAHTAEGLADRQASIQTQLDRVTTFIKTLKHATEEQNARLFNMVEGLTDKIERDLSDLEAEIAKIKIEREAVLRQQRAEAQRLADTQSAESVMREDSAAIAPSDLKQTLLQFLDFVSPVDDAADAKAWRDFLNSAGALTPKRTLVAGEQAGDIVSQARDALRALKGAEIPVSLITLVLDIDNLYDDFQAQQHRQTPSRKSNKKISRTSVKAFKRLSRLLQT